MKEEGYQSDLLRILNAVWTEGVRYKNEKRTP